MHVTPETCRSQLTMFDTLVATQGYEQTTPPQVERNFIFNGAKYIFNLDAKKHGTLPQLTWCNAPDGKGYLTFKISLPKMLHGTNVVMLSEADIPRALDGITTFVSELTSVPFDAWTAKVMRLDVCYNWQRTQEEVYARLRALHKASMPRMVFSLYNSSPYWRNASQQVTAYAKLAQIMEVESEQMSDEEIRASVGVLRLEHRFLNSGACKRLAKRLGLPDRRADCLLRAHVADTVLEETMNELGLNRPIESGDSRLSLLCEKYGYGSRFQRLAGFIALCDAYGAENLIPLGIISRSRYYDQKRELEEAGAWLTSPTKRTLPPLRLVRFSETAQRASLFG